MTLPAGLEDAPGLPPAEGAALFSARGVGLGAMHAAGLVGGSVRLTDEPPPEFGPGAKGPHVLAWQRALAVTPESGLFADRTLSATRAWAKAAGFGDRSSVTPAMWGTAFGVTFRFDGSAVILPDGSRVELSSAAAEVAAILTPKGPA